MTKNNDNQKVIFYTGGCRAFRTTSIFHLMEIAEVYPVVLLSEEMDSGTEAMLKNKEKFPKLKEIVQVSQFTGKKRNLFSKNLYLYRLAKKIIKEHKPTMVILPTDTYLFDFYLMRFAKKIKAMNIVLNSDLRLSTAREMSLRSDLTHVYFDLPSLIPFKLKLWLIRIRKYLGYFFYNWILPISVGQLPFFGKSSRIFYSMPGQRADFRIVYSKQDRLLSIKDGIPADKIVMLSHPLKRFPVNDRKEERILTILFPEELYSFKRNDNSLIPEQDILRHTRMVIKLIADRLGDWQIIVKAHPAIANTEKLEKFFEGISSRISFVDPKSSLDQYVKISDAIVGLPPATSALITVALQCPNMPILSLDLPPQEIFGDCYKNFKGIEYVDNSEKLIDILGLIKNNKYQKNDIVELKNEGFNNTVEVLNYIQK